MQDFTRFSHPLWIEYAYVESNALGKDAWRVVKGFRYEVGKKGSGIFVDIPRGYLMDGASSPRFLWSIIPPWGAYGPATVVHDILCEYLSYSVNGIPTKITRKMADDILAEAMLVLGVNENDRDLVNKGVESFRKISRVSSPQWHRNKAELEAKWLAHNPEEKCNGCSRPTN